MKNADMPAMPVEVCATNGTDIAGKQTSNSTWIETGLTKREEFAARAMQGLCSACNDDGEWSHDPEIAALAAVEYADALLAALEKGE